MSKQQTSDNRIYAAIDLKSFYASVECVERGLNPLTANLVVADKSRTEKTICLAVSPSLKSYGIPGRARLFEVVQRVGEINRERKYRLRGKPFFGSSIYGPELKRDPTLELAYEVATPRMAYYMEYSSRIFNIYLEYVSAEDIHVYSIDEVFIDLTEYLPLYHKSAHELVMTMIRHVLRETGITATAGIGTNLYLAKIAMDIVAKKMPADQDGVRIAELDELSYRKELWAHRPLKDFWRVGRGYTRKLEANGLFTMGDIARCSLENEDLLYRLFGINAELLIDHAWGWEPCRIKDIKAYRPENNSLSSGQVLQEPYPFDKAKIVVREMTDSLVLDMVEKGLEADQMVLTVGYDMTSLDDPEIRKKYKGEVAKDWYGRKVPKQAHGSINLGRMMSSTERIIDAVMELYDRIVDPVLLVRRMYVVANHVVPEDLARKARETSEENRQLDLFTDPEATERIREEEEAALEREHRRQEAVLEIRKKYGKNAILKGTSFMDGATARERNAQIGGHRA
ncbi:MAG: DNA methylase [Lachnospiraceae bacterium]|nr:DNA methylase [Lachnospiraceae bacterium]